MSTTFCCLVRFAGAGPDNDADDDDEDDEAAETETGGRLDSKFATICSALLAFVVRLSPLNISANICLGIGLADMRDSGATLFDVDAAAAAAAALLILAVWGAAAAMMSCPEEEMGNNVAKGTGEAINIWWLPLAAAAADVWLKCVVAVMVAWGGIECGAAAADAAAAGGKGNAEKKLDSSESSSEEVVEVQLLTDVVDPAASLSEGSDVEAGICQAAKSMESAPPAGAEAPAADGLE